MEEAALLEYFLEDELDLNTVYGVLINHGEPGPNNNIRERRIPTFNEGYVANIVPNYTLSEFQSHFRMTRAAFQELCILVAPHIQERQLFISLEQKVLFFIWLLAKQESFLASSDRFGMGKGTGHYIFLKMLTAIGMLKEHFIQWPNERKCVEIATRIEQRCRIPGVVGAIDGSHIILKQPVNNAIDFYNRKEQHSIILQAVCDDRKMFSDVFIGMPGRVHDARVFRNSPLYDLLTGNPSLLRADQHILGDAAYPLLTSLLKPYRDNGHLTARQSKFNQIMSGQRSVIERAFALLKGKWRRLKFLDMSLSHKVPEVVMAACILHNFLLKRPDEEDDCNNYDEDINAVVNDEYNENVVDLNHHAAMKRDYISTLL